MVHKTQPVAEVPAHLVLVCDSGQGSVALERLKNSEGRLITAITQVNPGCQFALGVYTQKLTGEVFARRVDWIPATVPGITSMLAQVRPDLERLEVERYESGLDIALREAIDYFGADHNTVVHLVTDAVPLVGNGRAHGPMCLTDIIHLDRLRELCLAIEVVGYSDNTIIGDHQVDFIADAERMRRSFVDLALVKNDEQRAIIAEQSVVFQIARRAGRVNLEQFLINLFDDLRKMSAFNVHDDGQGSSDLDARKAVRHFFAYLDLNDDEQYALKERIFHS